MKPLDRLIQLWRFNKVLPHVRGRCLDVGCHDGAFLERLTFADHLGIDLRLKHPVRYQNVIETACLSFTVPRQFQTITCLATYEHLDVSEQVAFWKLAQAGLSGGGNVLLTIPGPIVDQIIKIGKSIGVLAGMDEHQHRDICHAELIARAAAVGFGLQRYEKFQFGLNHFFIFRKDREVTCS